MADLRAGAETIDRLCARAGRTSCTFWGYFFLIKLIETFSGIYAHQSSLITGLAPILSYNHHFL